MKYFGFLVLVLVLFLSETGCKKAVICEWPYREDTINKRCVEERLDITAGYRGYHRRSDGNYKPVEEFGLWAYHPNPKSLTLQPGTIEVILTDNRHFTILPQTWGMPSFLQYIHEGSGFVIDSFMEFNFRYTPYQKDSPSVWYTFRGVRPVKNY